MQHCLRISLGSTAKSATTANKGRWDYEAVGTDLLGVESLPAGEGKHAMRQRTCPQGSTVSGRNEAIEITDPTLPDPRLKQFKTAGDSG